MMIRFNLGKEVNRLKMGVTKKEPAKKVSNPIPPHNDQLGENASMEFAEDYDNKKPTKPKK